MGLIAQRIPRLEDERLLTGRGQYVDDISLPGCLEAAVLRSQYAHARIVSIDTAAAAAYPGVVAVYTAADLGEANRPFPPLGEHPGLMACINHGALASDVVRYVGEPIALVVAENRYVAEDALELIAVQVEPLPVLVDVAEAARPDAPLIHPGAPANLCGQYTQGTGDVAAALAQAPRVFRQRLKMQRGSAQPMETRGVLARPEQGRLTVWSSTQRPHRLRSLLAAQLGLPAEQVRAIAPDVGGAFGCKGNFYPEEVLIPFAALRLNRPVKWVEDRRESFVATTQERVMLFDVAVGTDEEGRVLGLQVEFLHDLGAYAPYAFTLPQQAANHLVGPYRLPAVSVTWRAYYTNCTPTAAYRGAGRPEGIFVIERTMDLIAREMGLDPAEVRRRNLIPAEEMPYDTGVRSGRGRLVYDSGDYPASQAAALEHLDYEHWRSEQARLRQQGRLIGIGLANYIEISSTQPFEGARLRVTPEGSVVVHSGAGAQGQGHRTTLAQIAADQLDLPLETIQVETGDTDTIEKGIGTFGSRTMILVGGAICCAAAELKQQALTLAGQLLDRPPERLQWERGAVVLREGAERRLSLAELARAAARSGAALDATHYYTATGMHVANGTHAAVVEVDPTTGFVTFHRYVVVHDCGTVVNPLLADGQTYGGVAQSLGNCLLERLVYDEAGQLLTGSYMDYLLPTASEIPAIELHHLVSPSPHNPLGVKGGGEGGALPVYAVVAAAVEDAVGRPVRELPLTPTHIRDLIRGEGGR